MAKTSRRSFTQQAALVAASAFYSKYLRAEALLENSRVGSAGELRGWIRVGDRHFERFQTEAWQASTTTAGPEIEIDPARRFQHVLGFGGAFTDASCYLLSKMAAGDREKL